MNTESRLLHDPETGDWIVNAPRRSKRPDGNTKNAKDAFSPSMLNTRENIVDVYGKGTDRITVIENAFPVFVQGKGASGYQEILVEGTRVRPFAGFSVPQIEEVLHAYVERAHAFRNMKGLKSLIVFKNDGVAAGASQPHPHSQIFGLSFVPKRYQRRASNVRRQNGLTIFSDRSATAYANPTPRFPFEVIITTRRKIDNLTQATKNEILSLAKALHACLAFVRKRKLSFNYFFHDVFANPKERFEIRFVPRGVSVWGGFELDAGISVNPFTAEQSAKEYVAATKTRKTARK